MKKSRITIKYAIIAAMLIVAVFFISSLTGGAVCRAAVSEYSSVLNDLSKDKSFNVLDYPEDNKDYSIKLIQIGESAEGELFIYVYQPSAKAFDLTLQTIRFSPDRDGKEFRDYKLSLLNSNDTLFKYRVENYTVKEANTRYYNITAVHRQYVGAIDSGKELYSGIAVKVAQLWTAVTVGNTVAYSMEEEAVIELTGFTYGTMRLDDGHNFISNYACDSHFVAFSTDVDIDTLLEADVAFKHRTIDVGIYNHPDYGDWQSKQVTVTYKEQGTTSGNHWNNSKRTWDRIMSSSEYINKFPINSIPSDVAKDIKKQQWVLSYYETKYEDETGGVIGFVSYIKSVFGNNVKHSTEVSDVTILRLKYITDGVVYNLGVVSNKSGSSAVVADDSKTFFDKAKDAVIGFFTNTIKDIWNKTFGSLNWWQWILVALAVVVAIIVVLFVVFPAAGRALISLFSSKSDKGGKQ